MSDLSASLLSAISARRKADSQLRALAEAKPTGVSVQLSGDGCGEYATYVAAACNALLPHLDDRERRHRHDESTLSAHPLCSADYAQCFDDEACPLPSLASLYGVEP